MRITCIIIKPKKLYVCIKLKVKTWKREKKKDREKMLGVKKSLEVCIFRGTANGKIFSNVILRHTVYTQFGSKNIRKYSI